MEKPLNRLLGWWCNEDAEHGMARRFLTQLADKIRFDRLRDDLNSRALISVYCESKLPNSSTGNQPDLVIVTSNTALLVENKVYSPESGPTQYKDYKDELLRTYSEQKECRAILCARDANRLLPPGYSVILSHKELAEIFVELGTDARYPIWGRIAAVLCARAFQGEPTAPSLQRARALLAIDRPSVRDSLEILGLTDQLERTPVFKPWDREAT